MKINAVCLKCHKLTDESTVYTADTPDVVRLSGGVCGECIEEAIGRQKKEPITWVSVNDKLPEYATSVLLLTEGGKMHVGHRDFTNCFGENYCTEKEYGFGVSAHKTKCITHWMPLPDYPKKKGEEL